MLEIFKKKIIKLLKHPDYSPLKLPRLAKELGVSEQDYPQFKSAFEQLRSGGRVIIGIRNQVTLPPISGKITGTFRANPKGFGFVIPLDPNSNGDLFIPAKETASAMTGDTVVAKVQKKGRREGQIRYSGKIVEILQRSQNRFVGTLLKTSQGWVVQPDGSTFTDPISVDDIAAKNAKQNDKVVVEILSYPTQQHLARGVIIEVLGKSGRYDSETKSIIRQYHLPEEFPQDCIEQARKVTSQFSADRSEDREDITQKTIITIDPPDAKDFDDAISLEKNSDGNYVLGVHIADVSSFIPPDSPLDSEARLRGNSVYLPRKTIPMLPEILSNGICSLQPGQGRLVKSIYLTYDKDAKILNRRLANSVMRSAKRLTYQQADKILKGRTRDIESEVVELLKNMDMLSRSIEKRREKNGMLHLDLPDTELIMDKSDRVVDACPADDSYPHTIIEMFMVEANDAAASLLDSLKVGFMRRIHPEPDNMSMKKLSMFVQSFGLPLSRDPDRFAIQELLAAVKNMDCSLAINLAVLRSMEKAQYSPLNIGHFALASTHYCHFTSPIRRYADLLVHRDLQSYLQGSPDSEANKEQLIEIGNHIDFTEQRAQNAENELKSVLILQLLSSRIGDEIDCVIAGIAAFGVFARCRKFGIDGLIQLQDLGPDNWKYNQKTQSIVGENSGIVLHLGQAIKVKIVSVNIPARQLNLCPAEPLVDVSKKRKIKKRTTKNGKPRTRKKQKRKNKRR